MLCFRSDISNGKSRTPLHCACFRFGGREKIIEFLLDEEKKIKTEQEEGKERSDMFRDLPVPSYNMRDENGYSPAFWVQSSNVLEMMLQFDDLEIKRSDDMPLLWKCARRGIVSEQIAMHERLREQIAIKHQGTLPLEIGKHGCF